jgi:hypothetical protein
LGVPRRTHLAASVRRAAARAGLKQPGAGHQRILPHAHVVIVVVASSASIGVGHFCVNASGLLLLVVLLVLLLSQQQQLLLLLLLKLLLLRRCSGRPRRCRLLPICNRRSRGAMAPRACKAAGLAVGEAAAAACGGAARTACVKGRRGRSSGNPWCGLEEGQDVESHGVRQPHGIIGLVAGRRCSSQVRACRPRASGAGERRGMVVCKAGGGGGELAAEQCGCGGPVSRERHASADALWVRRVGCRHRRCEPGRAPSG